LLLPVFEQKTPFADKSPEREGWSAWGSGWKNSDHHPEAVHHPLDRACPPGNSKRGDGFAEFSPEIISPLASPCGGKEGGFLANNRPPSLMIRIFPA